MFAIIGLGNSGEKYTNTRHNVGRIVLDAFLHAHDFELMKKDNNIHSDAARGMVSGRPVEVIYPRVYVNLSGEPVKRTLVNRDITLGELIVVHDDVHLPLGTIRISYGRGAGGHNGVASLIKALHTKDFVRIRVGVAQKSLFGGLKKFIGEDLSRFVLKKFSAREMKQLEDVAKKVDTAIVHIVEQGVGHAMQECNA